jgi:hypothetical protein
MVEHPRDLLALYERPVYGDVIETVTAYVVAV